MSPNSIGRKCLESARDRVHIKMMCLRNDLGRVALLSRDTVLRTLSATGLSAGLGGSRLAAAIRQVAKAGYLGGPAALRGGSELRGIGRYHGGDAVGPAILTWRPCFDDAFTADLWTPPLGGSLLCLNFVRSACSLWTPAPCGVHQPLRCGAWRSGARAGRQHSLLVWGLRSGVGASGQFGAQVGCWAALWCPRASHKAKQPPHPCSARAVRVFCDGARAPSGSAEVWFVARGEGQEPAHL